ncbi:MAG: M14 family metallopeptidase [Vulcanimicrobiaceae bacterium]
MQNATYQELESRWKSLRRSRDDVAVREVACVNASRTLLCVEIGNPMLPCIALCAGVHGDEPAGPAALLSVVEANALDPTYAYRIWPCTNPSGYAARTRESVDGIDINRTFGRGGQSPEARAIVTANRNRRFLLSIDLHEDVDAQGFYCYEYGGGTLGRAAVAAVASAGYPVEPLKALDLGIPLAESSIVRERGRITADHRAEAGLVGGLTYSLLLARRAAVRVLTHETPGGHPWETRVSMHEVALTAVIASLSQSFHK